MEHTIPSTPCDTNSCDTSSCDKPPHTPKPLRSLSKVESAEALVARSNRYMAGAALYTRLDTILHYGDYFALLRGYIASGRRASR